jgi:hypothetical protein
LLDGCIATANLVALGGFIGCKAKMPAKEQHHKPPKKA